MNFYLFFVLSVGKADFIISDYDSNVRFFWVKHLTLHQILVLLQNFFVPSSLLFIEPLLVFNWSGAHSDFKRLILALSPTFAYTCNYSTNTHDRKENNKGAGSKSHVSFALRVARVIKANPLIVHIEYAVVIEKQWLADDHFHVGRLFKVLIGQRLYHNFAAELRVVFL